MKKQSNPHQNRKKVKSYAQKLSDLQPEVQIEILNFQYQLLLLGTTSTHNLTAHFVSVCVDTTDTVRFLS